MNFENIKQAIEDLKAGKLILVADDEDRENEGDLICTAAGATPQNINFIATYAKGLICNPMSQELADKLGLTPMINPNTDNHSTAFTVSIDHINTTTGISAFDRSKTIQECINPHAKPSDFRRPGHMFPLVAKDGGVLERNGHTEATVDLAKLAGCDPCGVCCEIMADDGTMMNQQQLMLFAQQHKLTFITIKELQDYLRSLK